MEVSGRQPGEPSKALRHLEESRIEVTHASRERLRAARRALDELSQRRLEQRQEARRLAAELEAEAARNAAASRAASRSASGDEHAREAAQIDRIELSPAARAAAPAVEEEVRARRVAELKELHAAGRLHTPERVERAATSLLSPS